jgi:hypothetical protein
MDQVYMPPLSNRSRSMPFDMQPRIQPRRKQGCTVQLERRGVRRTRRPTRSRGSPTLLRNPNPYIYTAADEQMHKKRNEGGAMQALNRRGG